MSHEVVEETLLILRENIFDLLLELRVSLGNITSFALSLFEQISDASIVSSSSLSATIMSPFQILTAYKASIVEIG